ncbi:helix-turn-helix domain-containing protein [Spirochaeta cellobiosiphila]|uniref:helix-turn-helix domain-containing protein n=1 Tax=Spirochaeta cellobiosiphila TaxID=504483 RepID=UPI0003FC0348|nr:helix-turn-helix domain-containing protein [Spirochaeta cellobiosiphila]
MAIDYIPSQPFFELSTKEFKSTFRTQSGHLTQYYSFSLPQKAAKPIVAVPDGTVDIIFHCSPSKPKAYICGSVKKGKEICFKNGIEYFGVRFLPGGAEELLDCPLSHFTDQEVLLEDVHKKTSSLIDSINMAKSFEERINLFESYNTVHQSPQKQMWLVNYMLERINNTRGEIRIQELADDTGFSARHINNVFKTHVGIAPKLFIRIVRFQKCFSLIRNQLSFDYTEMAQEAGYYDQAHFIKEFKEFSLCTPTQIGIC